MSDAGVRGVVAAKVLFLGDVDWPAGVFGESEGDRGDSGLST